MDPIIKQKLDKFATQIHGDIRTANQAIKDQCDAFEKTEIEKKQAELKAESEAFYEQRIKQTTARVNEAIAAAQVATRRDALNMRQRILQETVAAIEARAAQFLKDKRYQVFIKAKIASVEDRLKQQQSITLFANRTDCDWLKEHFETIGYRGELKFLDLQEQALGGIIVEVPAAHFRYNMTLKSMIDNNIDQIGAKLYTLFEEMEKAYGS